MNTTQTKTALPEKLYLVDHGENCGNAIRFEIEDKNDNLIASIEDENERSANKIGAELVHRYNTQPELIALCRRALHRIDPRNESGDPLALDLRKAIMNYDYGKAKL